MPLNYTGYYEKCKDLHDKELAEIMGGREEIASKANIARLVYDERQLQRKHELDIKLLQEQTKMMKSSNRTIAIFTITGTLLGSIVGAVVQATLPEMIRKTPKVTTQQSIQPDTKPSTSASRSENITDKVPSSPPK